MKEMSHRRKAAIHSMSLFSLPFWNGDHDDDEADDDANENFNEEVEV